jgi:transcriptional regulator with PAS, ATPase and Fis domain
MLEVIDRTRQVAPTDTTVLILGETGTGKELVARVIHAHSKRKDHTLISVNCAAFADNQIESELFGHEVGAFSGALQMKKGLLEAANGGTLFLDEIGDLTPGAQAGLLSVLEEGEFRRIGSNQAIKVEVRILVATNRNLQQMVEDMRFREDLYYRLNVFKLDLPPLRERGGDLKMLADALLTKMSHKIHRNSIVFDDKAYAELLNYSWPGNVRELENVIERAVILCNGFRIEAEDLALSIADANYQRPVSELEQQLSLDDYFVSFVKKFQSRFNETELAKMLGISRKNLWEKRQRLDIPSRKETS